LEGFDEGGVSAVWQVDQGHAHSGQHHARTGTNSEHEKTVTKPHRVYSGDRGEEIDCRLVTRLVDRQVRE
jgi:hypothetical protein